MARMRSLPVRLPEHVYEGIRDEAAILRVSMAAYIREAVMLRLVAERERREEMERQTAPERRARR